MEPGRNTRRNSTKCRWFWSHGKTVIKNSVHVQISHTCHHIYRGLIILSLYTKNSDSHY
ncbi:MAG: hypothetical protein WDO19_12865 [Bacteroidota bacterium]